jgi:hypothetical protein
MCQGQHVFMELPDEQYRYLERCARIRRISITRLVSRLITVIASEQLVLSVLDDDSKPSPRLSGETSKSRYRRSKVDDFA